MSDVATGVGGGGRGRRNQRPIFDHAGEVTRARKAIGQEDKIEEEPPSFTGSKIGGAANHLDDDLFGLQEDQAAEESSIMSTGGFKLESLVQQTDVLERDEHPLAAPAGWRRYWAPVTMLQYSYWAGSPDVSVSNFCKACLDNEQNCDKHLAKFTLEQAPKMYWRCRGCEDLECVCLRVVSYKYHALEDVDINRIPNFESRNHARARAATVGTESEIPARVANCMPKLPTYLKTSVGQTSLRMYSLPDRCNERYRDQAPLPGLHLGWGMDPPDILGTLRTGSPDTPLHSEYQKEPLQERCSKISAGLVELQQGVLSCKFEGSEAIRKDAFLLQDQISELRQILEEGPLVQDNTFSLTYILNEGACGLTVPQGYSFRDGVPAKEFIRVLCKLSEATRDLRIRFRLGRTMERGE